MEKESAFLRFLYKNRLLIVIPVIHIIHIHICSRSPPSIPLPLSLSLTHSHTHTQTNSFCVRTWTDARKHSTHSSLWHFPQFYYFVNIIFPTISSVCDEKTAHNKINAFQNKTKISEVDIFRFLPATKVWNKRNNIWAQMHSRKVSCTLMCVVVGYCPSL